MATSLRVIHDRSGMKYSDLHEALKRVAPEFAPRSLTAVQWMIQRGTDKGGLLNALSVIYDKPFAEILAAAQESKRLEKIRRENKQIVIKPLA